MQHYFINVTLAVQFMEHNLLERCVCVTFTL